MKSKYKGNGLKAYGFLSKFVEEWWIRHQHSPIKVLRWLLLWLLLFGVILLVTPAAVIGRLIGIRFLSINYKRIGHLAVEPDCFIKERMLGKHKRIIPWICAPENQVCNHALLECWKPYIRWVANPVFCFILKPFELHPLLFFDVSPYALVPEKGRSYIMVAKRWGRRNPIISLPEQMIKDGEAALEEMGVPKGAWFVCVHNREGGYSPEDENWHSYRNCSIDDYVPAMEKIVKLGGWCIRIGDHTMSKLQSLPNVVDYAHHFLKTDWLDIYLLAHCRFFLGNTSGPFLVSSIFNRPVALANMVPIGNTLHYGHRDLAIPKLIKYKSRGEYIGFPEILGSSAGDYQFSEQYRREGLVVVNNSADEIRDLALEMIKRVNGEMVYTKEDDDLQEKFKSLMQPHHISFGSESRIGKEFIKKYNKLLD